MKKAVYSLLFLLLFAGCGKDSGAVRFVLLTDTHVSGAAGPLEDLQRSLAEIKSNDSIDFVIISGDLTENGDRTSMELIKRELDALKIPYYVTSGNHETTWSESGVMDFSRVFGSDRFEFTCKGVYFIGFNSGPIIRMSSGHVAPQDVAWIARCLDSINAKKPDIPVVVITHYPLVEGDNVDNWYEVTDVLRKYNVQAIVGGHHHRNLVFSADGIPNILARSNLRDADDINGYTLVTLLADSIRFFEKRIHEPAKQWHVLPFSLRHYAASDSALRPSFAINEQYASVREAWKTHLNGSIYATVAFAEGRVFVGDDIGVIYALDAATGEILWQYATEQQMRIVSTPAVQDNSVIVGSTDGNIYCLAADNGELQWRVSTPKAVMGSPVISENVVFIGGSDGSMRALRLHDGSEIWRYDSLQGYCTGHPIVHDGTLFFGVWDTYFYALDTRDGHLIWKWSNGSPNIKFSPAEVWPVIAGNKLFITAPDRFFTCLDVRTGKEIWRTNRYKVRENVALNEEKTTVYSKCMWDTLIAVDARANAFQLKWASHIGFGYCHDACMPLEKEGTIFVGTKNGVLYGVESKNGALKWVHKICNSILNTPVVLNAHECLITSSDGTVTRIKAE